MAPEEEMGFVIMFDPRTMVGWVETSVQVAPAVGFVLAYKV